MKPAVRRRLGRALGAVLGASMLVVLAAPGCEQLHAPGPMNAGHGSLACAACHVEAPGSVRQQLQSAARAAIANVVHGEAGAAVDVGYRAVSNRECLECHERPDDRHPVFRFLEPRFADVRAVLRVDTCEGCHREHAGVRVTMAERTFCRHCHADTALARDPIDVSHRELIATGRWDSCLGCHDFHGNHAAKPVPVRLQDAHSAAALDAYFAGTGPSPYGPPARRAR